MHGIVVNVCTGKRFTAQLCALLWPSALSLLWFSPSYCALSPQRTLACSFTDACVSSEQRRTLCLTDLVSSSSRPRYSTFTCRLARGKVIKHTETNARRTHARWPATNCCEGHKSHSRLMKGITFVPSPPPIKAVSPLLQEHFNYAPYLNNVSLLMMSHILFLLAHPLIMSPPSNNTLVSWARARGLSNALLHPPRGLYNEQTPFTTAALAAYILIMDTKKRRLTQNLPHATEALSPPVIGSEPHWLDGVELKHSAVFATEIKK